MDWLKNIQRWFASLSTSEKATIVSTLIAGITLLWTVYTHFSANRSSTPTLIKPSAPASHQKSLVLHEDLRRQAGKLLDYGIPGIIYQTGLGDLDQAETMFQKSLAIEKALDNQRGLAATYNGLGSLYRIRGDLDQAETMFQKSLAIEKALDNQGGLAATYNFLGLLYQSRGDLDQAETMFQKSLAIEKALDNQRDLAAAYIGLGSLYRIRGDLDQAEAMFRNALKLFLDIGDASAVDYVHKLLKDLTSHSEGLEPTVDII